MGPNLEFDLNGPFTPDPSIALARTAANIALKNFEWRYITFVVFNCSLLSGVSAFAESYGKSILMSRGNFALTKPEETRQFVIFGGMPEISYALQAMRQKKFYNIGKHIVICLSGKSDCNQIEAMEMFWNFHVTNVVFLKESRRGKFDGYTYFFNGQNCGAGPPVKLEGVYQCAANSSVPCKMFPVKLKNLYRCTIIASTFIQAPYMNITEDGLPFGADGDVLRILAQAINATLKMRLPLHGSGWGELTRVGWIGSLGDLEEDLANLSMSYAAITMTRFNTFQMSITYNFNLIGWVTHPTEYLPSSFKLFLPFRLSTHLAVASIFIIVIICHLFIRSHYWVAFSEKFKMSRCESISFYFWMISMGMPVNHLPKKRLYLLVVYLLIWYSIVIRTSYTASLVTFLKTDQLRSNVNRLSEVLKKNYVFGGGSSLKEIYLDDMVIYNNWIDVHGGNMSQSWLKKISEGMKAALAINLEHVATFKRIHKAKFHILQNEVVINSPVAIYFQKFSPLADQLNFKLRCLIETGFISKFHKDSTWAKKTEERHDTALTVEHYHGCYAILAMGWLISAIVYVWEVCYFKYAKTSKVNAQ